jgi:hypothetical protein
VSSFDISSTNVCAPVGTITFCICFFIVDGNAVYLCCNISRLNSKASTTVSFLSLSLYEFVEDEGGKIFLFLLQPVAASSELHPPHNPFHPFT